MKEKYKIKHIKHNCYESFLAENDNGEVLSFVNFMVIKENKKAWIYLMRTNQKYGHKGIASKIIQSLEKYLVSQNIFKIDGIYFPEGEGAEYAKKFWEKNGYKIVHDGYQQFVYKYIDRYNFLDH